MSRLINADALMIELMDSDLDHLQRDDWREVIQIVADAPTVIPEPHWIPVTERLPNKEEKSYWVCLEGGGQCQCRWTNDMYGLGANEWSKWGWHVMDKPQYSVIVAWMPLPEPFKGVTE